MAGFCIVYLIHFRQVAEIKNDNEGDKTSTVDDEYVSIYFGVINNSLV